jgi:hypothetical protein
MAGFHCLTEEPSRAALAVRSPVCSPPAIGLVLTISSAGSPSAYFADAAGAAWSAPLHCAVLALPRMTCGCKSHSGWLASVAPPWPLGNEVRNQTRRWRKPDFELSVPLQSRHQPEPLRHSLDSIAERRDFPLPIGGSPQNQRPFIVDLVFIVLEATVPDHSMVQRFPRTTTVASGRANSSVCCLKRWFICA